MRDLLFKSAMVAPLVMGIALACFADTEADNHLPGRVVDSTEASAVLGTGECFFVKNVDCSGCTGQKSTSGTKENEEDNGSGCDANCETAGIQGSCNGG